MRGGIEENTGDCAFRARFSLTVLKAEKWNGKSGPKELIKILVEKDRKFKPIWLKELKGISIRCLQ